MKCSWCRENVHVGDEGYAENALWAQVGDSLTPIFFCSSICCGHYVERRSFNKARAEENKKNKSPR